MFWLVQNCTKSVQNLVKSAQNLRIWWFPRLPHPPLPPQAPPWYFRCMWIFFYLHPIKYNCLWYFRAGNRPEQSAIAWGYCGSWYLEFNKMWNFLRFAWFYLDLLDFDGIWWILKDFDRFPMVFRRFALVFPLQKSPQRPETVSNALKPSCTHLGCQGMRLEGPSGPFRPWKAQIWHSEHFIFRLSLLLMSTTVIEVNVLAVTPLHWDIWDRSSTP